MEVTKRERVTVRVSSREPVRAKLVDVAPSGYAVERANLDTALSADETGLAIAASRHGETLDVGFLGQLAGDIHGTDGSDYTVAFGAPERGLPAILGIEPAAVREEPSETGGFDLWLNTVPNQGSEVVRTEEAVFATLACLNIEE
jgi:predicted SPOUT superfamily RNA methylase MTH1